MLPNREFVISLSPTSQQMYRGGVIARRAGSYSTRDALCARGHRGIAEQPDGPRRTVVYLNVFVCPGPSTCASGGDLQAAGQGGLH